MKRYYITKTSDEATNNEQLWEGVTPLSITCYPWDVTNYKPEVEVKLAYTDSALKVRFVVEDNNLKITYTRINDPVYKDSCVEFFINPNPENDHRYMNFEINAAGVFLLAIGGDRGERLQITGYDKQFFQIKSSVTMENIDHYNQEEWFIEFAIPFAFLEKYYGEIRFESGYKMKGNFYKCGDDTTQPHFGCWSPIQNEVPDFHRPEYFGELILR